MSGEEFTSEGENFNMELTNLIEDLPEEKLELLQRAIEEKYEKTKRRESIYEPKPLSHVSGPPTQAPQQVISGMVHPRDQTETLVDSQLFEDQEALRFPSVDLTGDEGEEGEAVGTQTKKWPSFDEYALTKAETEGIRNRTIEKMGGKPVRNKDETDDDFIKRIFEFMHKVESKTAEVTNQLAAIEYKKAVKKKMLKARQSLSKIHARLRATPPPPTHYMPQIIVQPATKFPKFSGDPDSGVKVIDWLKELKSLSIFDGKMDPNRFLAGFYSAIEGVARHHYDELPERVKGDPKALSEEFIRFFHNPEDAAAAREEYKKCHLKADGDWRTFRLKKSKLGRECGKSQRTIIYDILENLPIAYEQNLSFETRQSLTDFRKLDDWGIFVQGKLRRIRSKRDKGNKPVRHKQSFSPYSSFKTPPSKKPTSSKPSTNLAPTTNRGGSYKGKLSKEEWAKKNNVPKCAIHQQYGHTTNSCYYNKEKRNEDPPQAFIQRNPNWKEERDRLWNAYTRGRGAQNTGNHPN